MKKLFPYFLITIFCLIFFSYRLTQVPQGLTIDESAFGYNAVLLSETFHDENNRFLPAFVLSINGKDWRQPVTQYFMAGYFKLFGASIYNLKFTSVVITTVGGLLIFILGNYLLGKKGGALSLLFYATTPVIMIHSHLGLDNIMPIPFVLVWLICIYLYEKSLSLRVLSKVEGRGNLVVQQKKLRLLHKIYTELAERARNDPNKYLILSALSLGIGFYSYKGMRSFVPVWSVITTIYLVLPALKSFWNPAKRGERISWKFINSIKKDLKPTLTFILSILPFYAIIPLLEYKYAGAVLGQTNLKIDSVYKFLLSYISSFDFSFLFITGDILPHHSTGVHGVFLLASLPFFLIGLYQLISSNLVILEGVRTTDRIPRKFFKLLTISFFTGPILFGFPGSIHRASRLIALVPIYSLISALGATHLLKGKRVFKIILASLAFLVIINYYNFVNYYWFQYPKDTYHIFYRTEIGEAYETLYEEAENKGLKAYVDYEIVRNEKLSDQGITDTFLRSIYFPKYPNVWNEKKTLLEKSILMSKNPNVLNLEKLNTSTNVEGYYFFTSILARSDL
ncbi:glycosyltransferase family 39 protein [Patescibacteria group bacterium]|nr:glycosyltransferase family 39 protein [Patescibacteria group bacterium]